MPFFEDFAPAPAAAVRVLWVGVTHGVEIGRCLAAVAGAHVATPAAAVAALRRGERFDLIVCACARPLADTSVVEQVAEAAADGSVVQLLGVWCEGEGRTGRVVDGVERVFWHAWPEWLRRRFDTPASAGGATDSDDSRPIAIDTADRELADAITDALADAGLRVAPRGAVRDADATTVLFDAAQLGGHEADRLADVCRVARRRRGRVVVLLDFPRPETVDAAGAIGAAAVLAKPFDADDLLAAVTDANASTAVRRPVAA